MARFGSVSVVSKTVIFPYQTKACTDRQISSLPKQQRNIQTNDSEPVWKANVCITFQCIL